ncbi:RlpA-like double-psi beta-barrel-protein domain-containing protein-containing protein [Xylariaceae sp. FL1272]|nr:RlpA-like double-psi beta-barrel-protein domain-containing protein-containing protein [Xylariaceae sp. FL1272]
MFSLSKIILALAATTLVSAVPVKETRQIAGTFSGDLTYYAPGLGACGVTNLESDSIVAISKTLYDQYTPGTNPNLNTLCGKQIQITIGDKSTIVTVEDRCEACAVDDLDVPVAVFSQLADPNAGRVQMSWVWLS